MSTETTLRFTEAERVVFFAWLQEHPGVAQNRANANAFGNWLQANNMKATLKNLNTAHQALKAAGQLEIYKTPAEVEEEKIEQIRAQIYREVSERISPAVLNFADWNVLSPLSKYLYDNHAGRMTADTLYEAIVANKLSLPWTTAPKALDKSRKADTCGFEDSRGGLQTKRRNHADSDDARERQERERAAADKKQLSDDEAQTIGKIVEADISSVTIIGMVGYQPSRLRPFSKLLGNTTTNTALV